MFLIIMSQMTVNTTYTSYVILIKLTPLGTLKKELYEFYNDNTINSYNTWPLIVGSITTGSKSMYESCINNLKYNLADVLSKNRFYKRLSVNVVRKNKSNYVEINYVHNFDQMSISLSREKLNLLCLTISNVLVDKFSDNIMKMNDSTFKIIRLVEKYISKFIKPVFTLEATSFIRNAQNLELFGLYKCLFKEELVKLSKSDNLNASVELISLYYSAEEYS